MGADASLEHDSISLIKAHAYGNDFLIADEEVRVSRADEAEFARRVCDRHRGIGADGLLLTAGPPARVRMRLLNADGSPSEISGNGVRCLAAWLAIRDGCAPGGTITIVTDAGPKPLRLLGRDGHRLTFVAEMGPPTGLREADLEIAGALVRVVVLRVGNPQCVVLGPVTDERLHALGGAIARHPFFPEGTNVEFAEVVSATEVRILIWERGVGPTESSGTGACAAAVAASVYGGAGRAVDVVAPGGRQHVEWTPDTIRLTGWAEVVGRFDWWLA